jgi:signal transduction histidine kinase
MFDGPEARKFRLDNDKFLCNREVVEVYWNSPKGTINISKLDQEKEKEDFPAKGVYATKSGKASGNAEGLAFSGTGTGAEAEFRKLIGDSREGTIARFLQNQLTLFYWYRPARADKLVFGSELDLPKLVEKIEALVRPDSSLANDVSLALLNDQGKPVVVSDKKAGINWSRPLLVNQLGDMLPHWQLAVGLIHPQSLAKSASSLKLFFGLLIGLLIFAIFAGSWLILSDLRREVVLARKKSDFVSNVSHELKTPLTAIRMFSELLLEDRVQSDEKKRRYLQIITAETARLSRLIGNVLDFNRIERGQKEYQFVTCDLKEIVERTVQTYGPHLIELGYKLETSFSTGALPILADADSVSQIIVNLLSNAEKYGGKEITIVVSARGSEAVVEIMDRGSGVPDGSEEKIFEAFYRACDSLDSGTQGSGLGLALAREMARAHRGEVSYRSRSGGGSVFEFRIPLREENA